jgi:hypothetical protein
MPIVGGTYMLKNTMPFRPLIIVFLLMLAASAVSKNENQKLEIILSAGLTQDEAIKVVLSDLQDAGRPLGITFTCVPGRAPADVVVLGTHRTNLKVIDRLKRGKIILQPPANPEGFEMATIADGIEKSLVVSGRSAIGTVYGLYWLLDRMRVTGTVPVLDLKREPELLFRKTRTTVTSKEDLRRALRFGVNVVFGENPLRLIPWESEPEKSENSKTRQQVKELIAYAHSLHIKYLAFGTDFTYHPSLLQEYNATLSLDDSRFWDAVQAKYRRLFQAMPELDGLGDFMGEEQSFWGEYRTFDPIHDGKACGWTLEKRYRTFITKVHKVVAGEFNKLYFHVTWDNNPHEVHAQPQVYRKIFTDEVPSENLYLIPSSTQNDRWWFQAYNPTFNVTPHHTLVVFETMDYHHGANVFPTYPGPYYQAWLQSVLENPNCNLQGANMDMPAGDECETRNLTAYTISRLSWDHRQNAIDIARDFAAIHFGAPVADGMAEILIMSPNAYKYGLYIEPVTYGQFTSLPHIRVGSFVVQGFPTIDKGKEHIEFLRKLYVRCKPWLAETVMYLDHGLELAETMCEKYRTLELLVADKRLAVDTRNALEMTRLLIKTNNLYVKTFFSYFQYEENQSGTNREQLSKYYGDLQAASVMFAQVPGFGYDLAGVNQLLANAKNILTDFKKAAQALTDAPTPAEIEKGIAEQQQRYRQVLKEYGQEAVKLLHWEGRVDGIDLLKIKGKAMSVEHIKWDGIYFKDQNFSAELPQAAVTVVPLDIESRPAHPFVLQQPNKDNNFTATVLLNDLPGGAGWCKFDLYFINQEPEKLGLANPWAR